MAAPVYTEFDVNGHPVYAENEKKAFLYWDLIKSHVFRSFDKVSSDQVYGVRDCKHSGQLAIYHQLAMFLDIICQERMWDKDNSDDGKDLGNSYYMDENCIQRVKSALYCRMDKSLVNKIFTIFELYDLNSTVTTDDKDGIGFMGITASTGKIFRIS